LITVSLENGWSSSQIGPIQLIFFYVCIIQIRCSRKKNCPPIHTKKAPIYVPVWTMPDVYKAIYLLFNPLHLLVHFVLIGSHSKVHRYRFAYELRYSIKPIYTYKCNILYFFTDEVGWIIQLRMNVCLSEVNR